MDSQPNYPLYLFAYGSLMAMPVFRNVVKRSAESPNPKISKAVLKGFRRRAVKGKWYPGITPYPTESVEGMVIQLNSYQDLVELDRFEGDEYKRVMVTVEPMDEGWGESCQAFVYEWLMGVETLDEKDWSLDQFVARDLGEAGVRNGD
ncbi:hypothetical protein HDU67_008118 [Dinochytrium kinnereticum]|nr:hypothetical protein HDU67_008118 [Dinochytrium kinnereticum]